MLCMGGAVKVDDRDRDCVTVTISVAFQPSMPKQNTPLIGRPPKPGGALTAAQRKAAQRERDRTALRCEVAALHQIPTSGLVEGLPGLIAAGDHDALAAALVELGKRGGLKVAITRPVRRR